ncbi:hypothetical protein, partial [Brevundimonas sp.]|uniref:hypothetical protein n=1 Tax=Brevundimonas sp. TaxID=1871086 RepID=UPI002FCA2B87
MRFIYRFGMAGPVCGATAKVGGEQQFDDHALALEHRHQLLAAQPDHVLFQMAKQAKTVAALPPAHILSGYAAAVRNAETQSSFIMVQVADD